MKLMDFANTYLKEDVYHFNENSINKETEVSLILIFPI